MQTVLFDFGNVVGFFDHRIAVRKLLRHCDLDESACFAALYDTALEDDFEAGRVGGDEFVRKSASAIQFRGSPAEFRTAFQNIFRPNPDVCALIPRLAEHYRLILASNTNELHSAQFRDQFGDVLRSFSALCLSHEAGARKPHRQFFEHCQQFVNCPPDECLLIDDLAANVEGARAFGWHAIRYTSFPDLLQQLRNHGVAVH